MKPKCLAMEIPQTVVVAEAGTCCLRLGQVTAKPGKVKPNYSLNNSRI